MNEGRGFGALAVAGFVALAVAGCGGDGGTGGGGDGGGSGKTVAAPAGGWPQPENGRLTEKMCGLLTEADYAEFGHNRMSASTLKRADDGSNAVSCLYTLGDELAMDLQTTAEAAKIAFERDAEDHKRRLASDEKRSVFTADVVQGADESWFDFSTIGSDESEFELQARRGALTVKLVLNRGEKDKDPRQMLPALAGRVFQRVGNLGKADTGITHRIRYELTGTGKAQGSYIDPATVKAVQFKDAKLPWHKEFPVPAPTGNPVPLTLNAYTKTFGAPLGCRILVDNKPVVEKNSTVSVFCSATYSR
ncbi:hypothetical protein [Actinomadura fibrosa]|uniref:Lipoprotein n=1 Tax=Actinomadura fibrosa TaxID=111802 RepID=A0ABW2XD39_9ACTN|nr:hypothetical protein [Actinomadura fibrosa]